MATGDYITTAYSRRYYSYIEPARQHFWWRIGTPSLLLCILLLTPPILSQEILPSGDDSIDTGICKSVDIRNSLDTFNGLEGCRVVEGFVQILLFDNVNETLLSAITFPDLVEITDYLLLYRVNGLRSIGQLFPNLTVIRGQNTFYRFALVIFEMSSLQEIDLYSLTNITSGFVRIDKNPSLCFVNSIDWDQITTDKEEHYYNTIKPENECPICPGEEKAKDDDSNNEVPLSCPIAPFKSNADEYNRKRNLCWNRQHCQKICLNKLCSSCNSKGECCDKQCLGGCADDDRSNCKVCNNFDIGIGSKRRCVDQCPPGTLKYLGRRCVHEQECRRMAKPINSPSTEAEYPYKVFQNSCLLHCPKNMNDVNQTCKPCEHGRCLKECPGVNINSIALSKQLRGCTHITGSLEIQIRGGSKVVNELEENLSMIEEIEGYLKVVRSFPLVSLNFLKNLKRIKGKSLESQKYVFVVLDNQNLQDLWDWENRTLEIDEGRLFFHFNPKLCLDKIRTLQQKTNLSQFTDLEVASNSNGDRIACNVTSLKVTVDIRNTKGVVLLWNQFILEDMRKLLGYIVYSIESVYMNITLYDGRDACGGDGWQVDDVASPDDRDSRVNHPLTHLKPYTQYAFYVKTYTIATEPLGAQSKIQYFRTLPTTPTQPLNLETSSDTYNSLKIVWNPPAQLNGNVTHYIVTGKKHNTKDDDKVGSRNYCQNQPASILPPMQPTRTIPTVPSKNDSSCECHNGNQMKSAINEREEERSERNSFEDLLHNEVYVRKDSRKRRDVYASSSNGNTQHGFPEFEFLFHNEVYNIGAHLKKKRDAQTFPDNTNQTVNADNKVENITENGTDIWISFQRVVYMQTELFIDKLHHYTLYDITVRACREKEGDKDLEALCSRDSMTSGTTQFKDGADDISIVRVSNKSLEMVTVTWDCLPDPNGMVFKYIIEYRKVDGEKQKTRTECITHYDFLQQGKSYTLKLSPGNYTLRVMATTAGGDGKYSPYITFVIEESNSTAVMVMSVVLPILLLGMLGFYVYYRRQKHKESIIMNPSINPEYMPSVYVPDDWEIPRKNIELLKELGQGSFGMVYEGMATVVKGKPQVKCAVKTVNEHATNRERLEFLNEASVMKAFHTEHVVELIGVVSQGQPTLVIMELMANGDLKSYLRSHRPDTDSYDPSSTKHPTLKQILHMAIEISDGMAYLSAKKFVHRDLAARNCMVSDNLTVKIGDFGMTRDIYETDYYRKGTKGLLPVRWMAPESLKDGVFTSSSDVWSYGVVLWEMATLASQPYQGLSNDQVLRYVIDGGVMERPENCPDKLYTLMRYCWQHKSAARPSFLKLCSLLLEDADPYFTKVSFYHSSAGIEARTSRPTPSPSQDDACIPLRPTGDLEENFSLTNSDDSDTELGIESSTHINFPSITIEGKDGVIATANGYVSGCPTNGAATGQC